MGLLIIILCAVLITLADTLLKHAAGGATWFSILTSGEMLVCYGLYLLQIILGIWIFRMESKLNGLGVYVGLFVIFYAALGALAGCWFFGERMSVSQILGLVLGVVGACLLGRG